MRVKFLKGEQRKFIKEVLKKINSPSLNDLRIRLNMPYSTIKKYYCELRLMPYNLFIDLCFISKIDKSLLKIKLLEDNWGQSKGGRTRKGK